MPSFSPYNDAPPEIIESPEIRQVTSHERGLVPAAAPSLNAIFAPIPPGRAPEEVSRERIETHITTIKAWSSEIAFGSEERAIQLLTYIQTCAGNQRVYELLIGLYLEQLKLCKSANGYPLYHYIPGEHVPTNIEEVISANGWRDLYEPAKERFLVYEKLLVWGLNAQFVLGLDHEQVKAVRQALRGVDRYYDQMCEEFPHIPQEQRHEMIVAAVREKLAIISQTPAGELRRHATFGQLIREDQQESEIEEEEGEEQEQDSGEEEEEEEEGSRHAPSPSQRQQVLPARQGEPLDFSGADQYVYDAPQVVYLHMEGLQHSGQHLTGHLTLPASPPVLRALDSALRAANIQLKVTKADSHETVYLGRLAHELEEEEF